MTGDHCLPAPLIVRRYSGAVWLPISGSARRARGGEQFSAQTFDLAPVEPGELFEDGFSLACRRHHDGAPVAPAGFLPDQAPARRPLDQAHHGVVAFLKELRELGDRGRAESRKALHAEEQLMLLRGDARGAGRLLAETQETAQLVARPGQALLERRGPVLPVTV